MIQIIRKVFSERADEVKWGCILAGAAWLIGSVMMAVVFHFNPAEDRPEAGIATLLAAMILLFYVLIVGIFGFATEFNLAVGMGLTRKQFMPAYLAATFMIEAVLAVFLYGLHFLETQGMRFFYSDLKEARAVGTILFSGYLIPGLLLLSAVQIFVGSILLKYGRKVMWFFWALWMVLCLLPGRISEAMADEPDTLPARFGFGVQKVLQALDGAVGIVLFLAVLSALLAVSVCLIRRQQVTSL